MTGRRTVLPRHFAAEIRKEQESLAAEIIRAIRLHVPEFSRPLTGQFGAGMQGGVEAALAEFADLVEGRAAAGDAFPSSSGALGEEHLRVYRALGRGELAEGRSLDALQAAYRLGARVAWRRYAEVARRAGLGPELVVALAEAVFAHIDEIASVSVQGYAEAKADQAGSLGRRRHRLLGLLVGGAPAEEVRQAAAEADWPLPDRIAGVLFGSAPTAGEGEQRPRLPPLVLADLHAPERCLLLPEPQRCLRDRAVRALLHGSGAVVGPTVPLDRAADSLRWARAARAALPPGIGPAPLLCDNRLPDLLLLGDAPLVRLMADRRLAPLAELTAKQSERLGATLLAWLQTNRGTAPEVAARLGIHPQTARQRLHRVQELFGEALTDADARFELEVALRGRLLRV